TLVEELVTDRVRPARLKGVRTGLLEEDEPVEGVGRALAVLVPGGGQRAVRPHVIRPARGQHDVDVDSDRLAMRTGSRKGAAVGGKQLDSLHYAVAPMFRRLLLLAPLLVLAVTLAGCGGASKPPPTVRVYFLHNSVLTPVGRVVVLKSPTTALRKLVRG